MDRRRSLLHVMPSSSLSNPFAGARERSDATRRMTTSTASSLKTLKTTCLSATPSAALQSTLSLAKSHTHLRRSDIRQVHKAEGKTVKKSSGVEIHYPTPREEKVTPQKAATVADPLPTSFGQKYPLSTTDFRMFQGEGRSSEATAGGA